MTRKLIRTCWQTRLWTALFMMGAIAIAACSGGGGGGSSAPPPGPQQSLALVKQGAGSGTVTNSAPPGGSINCGTACSGQTVQFAQGTPVTLTAQPSLGSVFSGWGNVCPGTDPCTVTLSADTVVPANFSPGSQNFTLTLVRNGGNGNVFSLPPAGAIACGTICEATLPPGTAVTLQAIVLPGATFLGWSGPCSGTGNCSFTMTGNIVVQANFGAGGPFDYSLAATPTSQLVFTGHNVSFTIAATLLTAPGTEVPVTLDVESGCPLNATCTFTTNPVTPKVGGNALSTLVITTAANTAPGPTQVIVRGTGGGVIRSTGVDLKVAQITPSTSLPRFAYVANSFDDTLSIYTVSANPGELRHRGYIATGITPVSVATDPQGKFVYVANHDVGTISGYAVTQTPSPEAGNLASVGPAVPSGKLTSAVLVHPTKNVLYGVNFATSTTISNGSVSVYSFNPGTGVLAPISCAQCQAGLSSTGMAIHPNGNLAYVANYPFNPITQPPISGFKILANGALETIALSNLFPNLSAAIAIDPTGKFLYTSDDVFNVVAAYKVNAVSGALTQVETEPAPSGPVSLAVDPSGKFLYVASQAAGKVAGYVIDPVTGALQPVPNSPFAAGTGTSSVTVDPSGNFVYATNLSSNSVSTYFIDPATGELTSLGLSRARREPAAMAITKGATAVTYVPKFAYTVNQTGNTMSEFSINPATGQLTPLGQTTSVTGSPLALAISPFWKFAYVVRNTAPTSAGLAGFLIDAVTGLLSPTPTPAFGTGTSPQDVTIESTSRFLYVANQNQVWRYQIDTTTGNLGAQVIAVDAGINTVAVTTDPTGQYTYAVNRDSNSATGYTINSGTGNLSLIGAGSTVVGTTPQAIVIDESGQFSYVALAGTAPGTVAGFRILAGSGLNGQLQSLGNPTTAGIAPVNLAVDPLGKWLFVTNSGDGTLSVYRVNNNSGSLTLVTPPIPVGNKPDSVTVDPSGKFVYVTVWGPDSPAPADPKVVAYALDPGTGLLTLVNSFAVGTQPRAVKTTGTIQSP